MSQLENKIMMKHLPGSTYRLQVNYQFNFSSVIKILDYLKSLGITDIYLSPIMQANPKSMHGYDIVAYDRINKDLGGEKIFFKLTKALAKNKMSLLLDFVPNHMAVNSHNKWWQQVLKKDKASKYAEYFDINWLNASEKKIVYRRFFDINELVCLNIQNPAVFNDVHAYLFKLIQQKHIQALRIDHIDGLRFPKQYLLSLRKKLGNSFYLIVEKILSYSESIPADWLIDGTTGYEFLNFVNQIFIYPNGFASMVEFYNKRTRNKKDIEQIKYEKNKFVIYKLFRSEFERLVNSLQHLLRKLKIHCSKKSVKLIVQELSAWLPVYRTYFKNHCLEASSTKILKSTFAKLKANQNLDKKLLAHIEKIICMKLPSHWSSDLKQFCRRLVSDWQVFTGPLMAKGYEDTTCYIYNPLVSINEVGSDPKFFRHLGQSKAFHQYNIIKNKYYPHGVNTTSTHDTKLSEDVRARINVLSELDQEWQQFFRDWHVLNKSKKTLAVQQMPSVNDEFRLYQILLGAWPLDDEEQKLFVKRLQNYFVKVLREAKIHSSWLHPNLRNEKMFCDFCRRILAVANNREFLKSFALFQKKIAFFGMLNSLSQTTLKIMSPGIADFYQGNELWRFDLVDPDNRRPVDFQKHAKQLALLKKIMHKSTSKLLHSLLANWQNGRIKMFLIHKLLRLRLAHSKMFELGDYIPLKISGKYKKNIIAFLRHHQQTYILVVVPRWLTQVTLADQFPLGALWENTELDLPLRKIFTWKNVLTDEVLNSKNLLISQLLHQFPIAVCITTNGCLI